MNADHRVGILIDGNNINRGIKNQDQQVKYLKNRSNKYANAMKNGKLTRKQARMSYKTIFIPSVKYGLPAC